MFFEHGSARSTRLLRTEPRPPSLSAQLCLPRRGLPRFLSDPDDRRYKVAAGRQRIAKHLRDAMRQIPLENSGTAPSPGTRAFLAVEPSYAPSRRMTEQTLTHRLARRADLDALRALMEAAISELQMPFLDARQIAASRTIMGLDTQLVDDGTYFLVEAQGALAGCGGWSRRSTLYGGDQTPGRDAALLDPCRDAARVRAMYTHPAYTRQGVGRLVLSLCEEAARSEGFRRVELMATLAGEPLYRTCGYEVIERVTDARGGVGVPLVAMGKEL